MDDIMSSTTNYMITKSLSSNSSKSHNNSAESGWTYYLQDFISNKYDNNMDYEDNNCYLRSEYETSSMVSDAAYGDDDHDDDELKDTATSISPAHQCPNVKDLKHLYMKSREQDSGYICQKKGHDVPKQAEEGIDMTSSETKLKRKGLCLVPMSLVLDYLK